MSELAYPVEKLAPGIIRRSPVRQPMQTGIMAIDAMIPVGRGQRELIIGDRSTGTTICIDTIINQARLNSAAEATAMKTFACCTQFMSRSDKAIQHRAPHQRARRSGRYALHDHRRLPRQTPRPTSIWPCRAAIGEWFMDHGMDALIIFDDLSKHAVAYRQVCLILKRPSGREAYPGDVCLHSRLLERAARVGEKYGNGSLTALPIIETQAGDVSAYIPTNVISITDGQIYLETDFSTRVCGRPSQLDFLFLASVQPPS